MEKENMEICSPATAKKLSNMARVILFMIQKVSDASKSKLMTTLDRHLLVKRGKRLRKSLSDVVLNSHEALTCRPNDVHMSYVSPVPIFEYEFSCSSSPPRRSRTPFHVSKRSKAGRRPLINKRHVYHHYRSLPQEPVYRDRYVPVADSDTESCHVDRKAEEFIERFYRQLRLQKWMAQEF